METKNKSIVNQNSDLPVHNQTVVQAFRSSPLPTPEELILYNDACPNAADRIIKMAEIQQEHRINLEKLVISQQMKESSRGQLFAFILGLIGLIGSIFLIGTGKEIGGSILGGSSLLGLVSLFLYGKREQKKNLEQKEAKGK